MQDILWHEWKYLMESILKELNFNGFGVDLKKLIKLLKK